MNDENAEREIKVASSLITLIDALTEKTRGVISSDNKREVRMCEEMYEDFSNIAGAVLKSTEYHEILWGKYSAAKTEIRNYFIKRAERDKSQRERATQEAGR